MKSPHEKAYHSNHKDMFAKGAQNNGGVTQGASDVGSKESFTKKVNGNEDAGVLEGISKKKVTTATKEPTEHRVTKERAEANKIGVRENQEARELGVGKFQKSDGMTRDALKTDAHWDSKVGGDKREFTSQGF